jgi:glutamine amidotransferase
MEVVIIKYNAGNVLSVMHALHRLGIEPAYTDDPETIRAADKVIFPGVGEASSAMNYLHTRGLDRLIKDLKQPVLGVCIGLQLMCLHSEENDTPCMGIFPQRVRKFPPRDKVPHIGWNRLERMNSPLFDGVDSSPYFYFVHSYYAELTDDAIATAEYIEPFSAALHLDNFYAVQFHPEKSGDVGARVYENFLNLC